MIDDTAPESGNSTADQAQRDEAKANRHSRKIQKSLAAVHSAQEVIQNTLKLINDGGIDFDASIVQGLESMQSIGEKLLDPDREVSQKELKAYLRQSRDADAVINSSKHKEQVRYLAELSKEQSLRTLANEKLYDRFKYSISSTGEGIHEFLSTNLSEISTTGFSEDLKKAVPLALAGPFTPLLGPLSDIASVGKSATKTIFGGAKAIVSKMFPDNQKVTAEERDFAETTRSFEAAVAPVEKAENETTESVIETRDAVVAGADTSREAAEVAADQSNERLDTLDGSVRGVSEGITEMFTAQQAAANGDYFAQEDARDAAQDQNDAIVGSLDNTTDAIRDIEIPDSDGRGSAISGIFGKLLLGLGVALAPFLALGKPLKMFAKAALGFPLSLGRALAGKFLPNRGSGPDLDTRRSGAPRSGAPRSGAPRSGAPRSGAPRSGAPRSGAPRSGMSKVLKGTLVVGAVVAAAVAIDEAFEDINKMSSDEIEDYAGGIGEKGSDLEKGVAVFRKSINNIFGGLPDMLSSWLSEQQWFASIIDGIFTQEGREAAFESLKGFMSDAFNSLSDTIYPLVSHLFVPLFDVFDSIKAFFSEGIFSEEGMSAVFESVSATFNDIGDSISGAISDMFSPMFDGVSDITEFFSKAIDGVLNSLPDFVKSALGLEGESAVIADPLRDSTAEALSSVGIGGNIDNADWDSLSEEQLGSLYAKDSIPPSAKIRIGEALRKKAQSASVARGTENIRPVRREKQREAATVVQEKAQAQTVNVVSSGGGDRRRMELSDNSLQVASLTL